MGKFSKMREAVKRLRRLSDKETKGNHFYRVDRNDASSYFFGLNDWRREVTKYTDSVREQGETTAFLDICGTTCARNLGCNMNYQFTIQSKRMLVEMKHIVPIVGDLFSRNDFNQVIARIKADGHLLSFTAFQPIVGLQSFTPKQGTMFENVVYHHLAKQLAKVVEITRDGGYILLERPFQLCPHDIGNWVRRKNTIESTSHDWMKRHARSLHCKIRVVDTSCGPNWLLCKGYAQDRRT